MKTGERQEARGKRMNLYLFSCFVVFLRTCGLGRKADDTGTRGVSCPGLS
jgi:hypothetical protein